MAEPVVELREASKSYSVKGVVVDALLPATCSVYAPDRIAIVGPSGSGKSTLLNLMAGIDTPSSGTVHWPRFGQTWMRPRNIGVIFQTASLLPSLTALKNVVLPLQILGDTDEIENRGRAALARFSLTGLAERLPADLSGGQIQRIAIARAIVTSPGLILADEPTGQLDAATAIATIKALLAAATECGAAVVVATHDASIATLLRAEWTMSYGKLDVPNRRSAA